MNNSGHSSITRDGVLSVGHRALCGALLEKIVAANLREDEDQAAAANHFDNCAFHEGVHKIQRDRQIIAAEADRVSVRSILALGRILHTVQDFYAHSNWIELHLAADPVPLWDLDPATLSIAVRSGSWTAGVPRCHREPACPTHGELNKDSDGSAMSRLVVPSGPNAGKTHWDLARKAAVDATTAEVRRLLAGTTDHRITVKTGDMESAGTDAWVFLALRGARGTTTGRMILDNVDHNDFERGNKDEFLVAAVGAPGEIGAITIGYEPHDQGPHPGWYLEWVKVEEVVSGRSWMFRANRWLEAEAGDRKTILELPASPA